MPISAPSMGSDAQDPRYQSKTLYEREALDFPDLTPAAAEKLLKQLGGAVTEKHRRLEAIGWEADIEPSERGVIVHFYAHEELIDDLIRRFEHLADREVRSGR